MPRRLFKQIIYATSVVVAFLSVAIALVVISLHKPPSCFDGKLNQEEEEIDCGGPCETCELRHLRPLGSSGVLIFSQGDTIATMVEVRNLNPNYGAAEFTYRIHFFDPAGATLSTLERRSFIYPGEVKKVVEVGIPLLASEVTNTRAEIDQSTIVWKPLRDIIPTRAGYRELRFETDASGRRATISALAVNEGNSHLSEIRVIIVLYTRGGFPVGLARTVLTDFDPGHERFFQVVVPNVNTSNIDFNRTELYLEGIR